MKKNFYLIAIILVSFIVAVAGFSIINSGASAQSAPILKQNVMLPRLYVSSLTLDKATYKAGETIKGTFDVQDSDVNATPDVNYIVSLVGLDKSGHVAQVTYDSQKSQTLNFAGNSTKSIDFSYVLKSAPASDSLAIHVRIVMPDGTSLAWKIVPIKVSGGVPVLQIKDAFLKVKDNQFSLQEGPVIKKGQDLSFTVAYDNPNSVSVSVFPEVTLFDKSGAKIDIPSTKENEFVVKSKSIASTTFALPVANLKPAVYLAQISFPDSKGVSRAPQLFARYIVEGDMASVRSVYSDKNAPFVSGQSVNIAVGYTGKPVDITAASSTKAEPVIADLEVNLFDAANKNIGNTILKNQQLNLSGFISMPVVLKGGADALYAEVKISQGSSTLTEYRGQVAFDSANISGVKNQAVNKISIYTYALAVLVLIVVALLFFFFGSKIKNRYIGPTALFLIIFCGFGIAGVGVSKAEFIITSWYTGFNAQVWDTYIFNVTGGPPSDVLMGQTFDVTGTFQQETCINASSALDASAEFAGQVYDTGLQKTTGWDESIYNNYIYWTAWQDFYLGSFTAPTGQEDYNSQLYDQYVRWTEEPHDASPLSIQEPINGPKTYHLNLDLGAYYKASWTGGIWSERGNVIGYWPVNVYPFPPINPSRSCSADGKKITFSWDSTSDNFYFAAFDQNHTWNGDWMDPFSNPQYFNRNGVGDGYTITADTGKNFYGLKFAWWVQNRLVIWANPSWPSTGAWSQRVYGSPTATDLICPQPSSVPPTVDVTAPATVPTGSHATVSWTSTNATSCKVADGTTDSLSVWQLNTPIPTAGSEQTGMIVRAETYKVDCVNSVGVHASDSVTITPVNSGPLSVTCLPNSSAVYTNSSVIWTATTKGGVGDYAYSWSGAVSSSLNPTYASYTTVGQQTANVLVRSGSQSANASCSVMVNQATIGTVPTCSTNISSAYVGSLVTWTVGGNSAGYYWSGDNVPTGSSAPTGPVYALRYSTIGKKSVYLVPTAGGSPVSCAVAGGNSKLQVINNPNIQDF